MDTTPDDLPPSTQNANSPSLLYAWAPLQEEDEIRVLVLKPGDPESPDLKCELRHVRLRENPTFEAISYAWDTDIRDRNICVSTSETDTEPRCVAITENLYLALLKFRRVDHERVLWADAVSIDQTNLQEKAKQVQMMGRIFHEASEVQVGLGPQQPISFIAFECIERLGEMAPSVLWPGSYPDHESLLKDAKLSLAEVLA